MAELKWRDQELTDSELTTKLNRLSKDESFKKVDFDHNRIESVPSFNKYKQFKYLEYLNLSCNKIVRIKTENLPPQVKHLDMFANKIREFDDLSRFHKLERLVLGHNRIKAIEPSKLPVNIKVLNMHNNGLTSVMDFSQCQHLETVNLSGNQITDIDPSNVPLNIGILDISNNKLTEVRDFTQHKQLEQLDLRGNQIVKIYDANRNMSSWIIDTLHEEFFANAYGYNHLKKCNFKTYYLVQPPLQVFKRGVKSLQIYFKDMAQSKRVKNSRKRYVYSVGMSSCLKHLLLQSLIIWENTNWIYLPFSLIISLQGF